MAISLVTSAIDVADGQSQTWSVTLSNISPSSGNLLVACLTQATDSQAIEDPSGWTAVQKQESAGNDMSSAMWFKISDGLEASVGGDLDTTGTSTYNWQAVILEFEGNSSSNALDDSNMDITEINTGSQTSDTGSATPTVDGYAVAMHGWRDSRFAEFDTHSFSNSFAELNSVTPSTTTRPIVVVAGLAYTGTAAKDCTDTTTDTGDENIGIIALFKEAVAAGATITLSPASIVVTGSTLGILQDQNISLSAAAITVTGGTLGITQGQNIALSPASIAVTGGTLGITAGSAQVVTLSPASIDITGGTLGVLQDQNITLSPASIAVTGGILGIVSASGAIVPTGGGGRKRRQRQFANINGTLVEVRSAKEAAKLFQHINKTKTKPKRRRIKLRVAGKVTIFDDPSQPLSLRKIHSVLDKTLAEEEELIILLLLAA